MNTVDNTIPRLIKVPINFSPSGSLGVIESKEPFPFRIKRIFYVTNAGANCIRGNHGHYECHEFLICLNGIIEVHLKWKSKNETFKLNDPGYGLYVPNKTYITLKYIKAESILLALASEYYDKADYFYQPLGFNNNDE